LRIISILLISCLAMFSCKTVEKTPVAKLRPLSVGRLLKHVDENVFDYSHFSVKRMNVEVDNGDSKTTFRSGMQAVKDKQIQISVTKFNIPLGRISLTRDSVFFINYLERNYLADDYRAVSYFLDFDLDFNAIQSILSGNVFSFFDDEKELKEYKTYIDEGLYILQSEEMKKIRKIDEKGKTQKMERFIRRLDENALIIQTFFFDPSLFVLNKMLLEDKTHLRSLELNFSEFEKVGNKYYPAAINVNYKSGEGKFSMEVRMAGFSTDNSELTPVRIPEKYQRLYLN
jgi:hypothetical protein